jgi:hypothetical protein
VNRLFAGCEKGVGVDVNNGSGPGMRREEAFHASSFQYGRCVFYNRTIVLLSTVKKDFFTKTPRGGTGRW